MLSRSIRNVLDPAAPALSPQVQRRIAAWALHHDHVDTIVALLGRDELIDELDATFSTDRRAKVRAAWLSRPDRGIAELNAVLTSESRETVLAAVASTPGLESAIYLAVIDKCRGFTPLLALINSDAPMEVRCAAVGELSRRDGRIVHADANKLVATLKDERDLRIEVLRVGTRRSLVSTVLNNAGDDELLEVDGDRLLDLLVTEPARAVRHALPPNYTVITQFKNAAKSAYRLLGCIPTLEGRRDEIVELFETLTSVDWPDRNGARAKAVALVEELRERPEISGRPIDELRSAIYHGTPAERSAAVSVLLDVKANSSAASYAHQMLSAAVLDGVLGPELKRVLNASYLYSNTLPGRLARSRRLSVDDAVTVAQVSRQPSDIYAALSGCEEPRLALERFLSDPATRVPSVTAFFSKYTLEDPELIPFLPAAFLKVSTTSQAVREVLTAASAYVLDRLGDDLGAWDLFEELASGSTSTIGALFDLIELSAAA